MLRISHAAALACALAAASCQTTGGQVATFIAAVQTGCGIVVNAADVARVIASGLGPTAVTAEQVAEAVCRALAAPKSTRAAVRRLPAQGVVTVNGIPVRYTRTR